MALATHSPSCPEVIRESPGLWSPGKRLDQMGYHAEWLQNLQVSTSLGDYRSLPPEKRDNR